MSLISQSGLVLLLMASAPAAAADGTCVGPVWIGKSGTSTQGPDFTVSRFASAFGPVAVYEGCCSQVTNDAKTLFLQKDGETIYRTSGDSGFSGYLTTRIKLIDGTEWHHQAHFFGDGLTGDDRDRAFFEKVRLGTVAERLCEKPADQAANGD